MSRMTGVGKWILYFVVFCWSCLFSHAQQTDITVVKMWEVVVDSAVSIPTDIMAPVNNDANIKNLPQKHHITSLRFLILNDPDWFKSYQEGYSAEDGWFEYGSSSISRPVRGSIFPVFITLDTIKNIKYFTIDANGNMDFSDDSVRSQNMDSLSRYFNFYDTLRASFQYKDGAVQKVNIPIKIYPYQGISFENDPLSKMLGISISYNKGLNGTLDPGGVYSYKFSSPIPNFGVYHEITGKKDPLVVEAVNRKNERVDQYWSFIGDTININNNLYYVEKLDREKKELVLRFVKGFQYGYNVGNRLQPFSAIDFISKQQISLTKNRDRYLLLDFWGTWCAPCIKGIPALKKMRQNNFDKIDLVSVAYDKPKDTSQLRKLIAENEMNWSHVWVARDASDPDNLIKMLKVEAFPTFILVDVKGEIIFRGSGVDELNMVEKLIDQ